MSCLCLVVIGGITPHEHLIFTFSVAFALSFFSAIHDIVSETYRFSFLESISHEASVPLQTVGFRTGQFLASAAIPMLASFCSWASAHAIIAVIKIGAVFVIFQLHEPITKRNQNQNGNEDKNQDEQSQDEQLQGKQSQGKEGRLLSIECKSTGRSTQVRQRLGEEKTSWQEVLVDVKAVLRSIAETPFVLTFLSSVVLIRVVDSVSVAMQTVRLGQIGVTSFRFGLVKGWLGAMTIMAGIPIASFMAKRFGLFRTLLCGIVGQSLAGMLSILLIQKQPVVVVSSIIAVQDFFQGVMNTLLFIYISSFCQGRLNVYLFTMFCTISSMSRTLATYTLNAISGTVGWNTIFCLPIVLCIPLTLLLFSLSKKTLKNKS
jgi:hypothetical protein